ncbi:LysR family transcriptional regulator [Hansschlegelia beijingensis]|uniref:DNA-binding transcriptional LysR family regulator n=1 Tax=Hansschlegelia beijingensis TaxID=1133344 RepID=A0A7W6D7F3_9HYPH|nr:LysR family transcriptional regulator [Hansschlegelia beijingensis]MBB3974563.1 DNA-binding transcriptional LysR family regulator [Hansschlegelia beijingensis]
MDWDKLRIFHAAADAGSFTKAGETLGLSQSAVSRQVSALEHELKTPLFHRHARGLILTEQGELLFRTTQEVFAKLESARSMLTDSRERPNGVLKVTTTVGLGSGWLTPRLVEFMDAYPDIQVQLILSDDELDLAMREADVAIRLRAPTQPDLIQRRLFTVHYHVYASADYLKKHGRPATLDDLQKHRLIEFGGPVPPFLQSINWLKTAARTPGNPRAASLVANSLTAIKHAAETGVGLAVLPDYVVEESSQLQRVLDGDEMPTLEAYFVYPEELKNVARIHVFRDFLVEMAQRWQF